MCMFICMRSLNNPHTHTHTHTHTHSQMEIAKGVFYLKRKNIDEAIKVFESFEKKDIGLVDQVRARACVCVCVCVM
jgi:hypothetical protein